MPSGDQTPLVGAHDIGVEAEDPTAHGMGSTLEPPSALRSVGLVPEVPRTNRLRHIRSALPAPSACRLRLGEQDLSTVDEHPDAPADAQVQRAKLAGGRERQLGGP